MRRRIAWMPWLATIIAAVPLTGCVMVPSEQPQVDFPAPQLRQYPAAEQQQAAEELGHLPDDAALREFMDGYGRLRDQVRTIEPPHG